MKILAIDTSADYLSLAIMDGGRIIGRFHRRAERSHSRLIIPSIDKLLRRAGLRLKEIDGFCISIGPGSFTGLRIGVTTVKGLAYSLKKPIAAVPTLDVIAQNAKGFRGIISPVLDAKKNKVYACLYKSDGKNIKRISKYLLISLKDLLKKVRAIRDNALFLGDIVERTSVNLTSVNLRGYLVGRHRLLDWHPRAEIVAQLGLEKFRKEIFTSPEDLEPLYLYSKECDIKGI